MYEKTTGSKVTLEGIRPLPLNPQQTSQLCEVVKNQPENNQQKSSTSLSPPTDWLNTLILYGGVPVAVILSMTVFCYVLLSTLK